jgi:hypothetical protein
MSKIQRWAVIAAIFLAFLPKCATAQLNNDQISGPVLNSQMMGPLQGGASGVPSWVLVAGGLAATADMSFATNQYYGCTLASCLSITRASSKTNLLPTSTSGFAYTTFGSNVLAIDSNGLLIEESRTNQLLNSTAPATQTTGTLAATAQTLWVNGSGSAGLSNGTATGCTGTATNGSPVTFAPTAGTCTVTVSGSLNAFQLEAGAFGTSLIVTTGTAATRAADNIAATGALNTILVAPIGTVYTQTGAMPSIASSPDIVNANNSSQHLLQVDSNTTVRARNGTNVIATLGAGGFTTGTVKSAHGWNGTAVTIAGNAGTVVQGTTSGAFGGGVNAELGSNNSGGLQVINGYIRRIAVWAIQQSSTAVAGLVQ